jgi:peptidoglycan/xylan/chitin deacetylase (PgdA/CDA1 family)
MSVIGRARLVALDRGAILWLSRRSLVGVAARLATRGRFSILVYHHVAADEGALFEGLDVTVSPEEFGRHMQVLASRYRVVTLDEALSGPPRTGAGRRTVVVTFDDGFRSVLTQALPRLMAAGIPATVFVCPGYVGNARVPLLFLARHARVAVGPGRVETAIAKALGRGIKADEIDAAITNTLSKHDSDRLKTGLLEALGVDERSLAAELRLFLSWDEVKELAAAGMSIGNHTMSHYVLSRLTEPEQRAEVMDARMALQQSAGLGRMPFAFPYGRARHIGATTVDLVKEAGHTCALGVGGDNAWGTSPYALSRTLVTRRVRLEANVEVLPALERLRGSVVGLLRRRPRHAPRAFTPRAA